MPYSSPQKKLHFGDVMSLLYHSFSFFFGREKAEESLLIHETQIRNGKEILVLGLIPPTNKALKLSKHPERCLRDGPAFLRRVFLLVPGAKFGRKGLCYRVPGILKPGHLQASYFVMAEFGMKKPNLLGYTGIQGLT